MAKPQFNKDITPRCAYCIFGKPSPAGQEVFCSRRGVTDKNDSCRRYKYDPLKRIPEKAKLDRDFSAEDFKL